MDAKQGRTREVVADHAASAEVAELVAIWRGLPLSKRRILLEQFRAVAHAERGAESAPMLEAERHS